MLPKIIAHSAGSGTAGAIADNQPLLI